MDLSPRAALGAVNGPRPGVGDVGGAVVATPCHEAGVEGDGAVVAVDKHGHGVAFHAKDGAGGAVVDRPLAAMVGVGVDEDPVACRVGAGVGSPGRSGEGGAAQFAAGGAQGADAIGEVFAVGVADGEDGDVLGAVAIGVDGRGAGEALAGVDGSGALVFPAVAGADLVAGVEVADPVAGERLAFGRVVLAAVLGEVGGWRGNDRPERSTPARAMRTGPPPTTTQKTR